jgi:hypothetical protein
VSFGLFSGFYRIRLVELQIDPQLESTIRPKARGLHSIWFLHQDNASTIEDLQEKNSRTLGNYLRRLEDYSRISLSTFQPRDASSTLEDLWLVELRDAWGLPSRPSRLLESSNYPTRLQRTRGLVVWTALGPLL